MDKEKWQDRWNRLWRRTRQTASDVGAVAAAGAAKAGQTAENVVAYTKIRVAIADLKAEVNLQLRQIGEMVYATHTGDPTDSDTMQTALEAVDALKEQIAQKERELQSIRGVTVCTACGCANPVDHVYCSNCGQPLER